MGMNPAIILLKNGTYLIALTETLDFEPKAHLESPHEITGKTRLALTPWPLHTEEKDILLFSTDILTAVPPTEEVLDSYLKKIGKTKEDLTKVPERVMLTEGDDYEPDYEEIPTGLDELY